MSASPQRSSPRTEARLESWKQIAAHLNRHVTTVRRWEKYEALPVHRHVHSALSSIYAYASELDAWMKTRQTEDPVRLPAENPAATNSLAGYPAPLPPVLNAVHGRSPMLGRESETAAFRTMWHTVLTGRQQIAVIAGEVGQGKTRLTTEFTHTIATQARILTGAWDREALVPFAPFVTILQWIVRTVDPGTLTSMLGKIAESRELAQLVPEISRSLSSASAAVPLSLGNRRFSMFEALAQLLIALARVCPVCLLFEDVHWADRGSLLFLRHLLRATRETPVLILVTCRENEPERGAISGVFLHEVDREFAPVRIRLSGLTAEQVRSLVDALTGRSASLQLTDAIVAATDGNPLFVTEMCAHLAETRRLLEKRSGHTLRTLGVPGAIREVLHHRFAHVSTAAKKILTLGSVIGNRFSMDVLELLLNMPEDEILEGLEEALAARVVDEVPGMPGQFTFTHALFGETLYAGIIQARRTRLHYRVGCALEQRFASQPLPIEELAFHFTEGAVNSSQKASQKAIHYAVQAAEQARIKLALEDAARYYGMALRTLRMLPSNPEVDARRVPLHMQSGRCWFQAGQWIPAKTEFVTAIGLLSPAQLEQRCELLICLAETSFWLMDVPSLRQFATEAEGLAGRIGRNDLWADARAWVASAKIADGDVLGGIASDRETLGRLGGIRSYGMARAPLTLYWAGHTVEAAAGAEDAVRNARVVGDPAFLLYALQHLGICLSGAGRYDEAICAFDEARAFGRECGAASLLARAVSMSVAPFFSLGDFAAATERAMEAREWARRADFEPPMVSAGIDLLMIYARTHDPGKAERLLPEVQQAVETAGGWHAWKWKMRLCQARAELALARRDCKPAMLFADQVIEQSNWRHRPKYQALALTVRARARHELGARKAVEDARTAVEIARRIADPALLSECLSILLQQDDSSDLLTEFRHATDQVLLGIADASLESTFLARMGIQRRTPGRLGPIAVGTYA